MPGMSHLIIGLGGTGGQVVRTLRKTLQERHKSLDIISEDGNTTFFDYIYVESSNSDAIGCKNWKTSDDSPLAAPIGLQPNNIIHIPASGLRDRINNLQNHPITAKYIGSGVSWPQIMNGLNLAEGAAQQIRRIGEATFENGVSNFRQRVQQAVKTLRNKSNNITVEAHVIAGLAGGTGSGTFLQVLAQLRSMYNDGLPISLYLTLPPLNDPQHNRDIYYYANVYAALEELDAYVRLVNPCLPPALHEMAEFTDLGDRLSACYLMSCENSSNASIDLEALWSLQAQFIYQRTVYINYAPGYQAIRRQISQENQQIRNDYNYKSFKSFGLKRILVPDLEIKRHLLHHFEQQAFLQMIFNHWQQGVGYVKSNPDTINFQEIVNRPAELERWKLTDAHFLLDRRILDAEGVNWRSIDDYWRGVGIAVRQDHAKASANAETLDNIYIQLKKNYENFRVRGGVEEFYKNQRNELNTNKTHSAAITAAVDAWVLDQWVNAGYSLVQLQQIIRTLIDSLSNRKQRLQYEKTALDELIDSKKARMDSLTSQLKATGALRFNRRERLKTSYLDETVDYYRQKTKSVAHDFADVLLTYVIRQLDEDIREPLELLSAILQDEFKRRQEKIDAFNKVAGREQPLGENIVKFYSYHNITNGVQFMCFDQDRQQRQSDRLRTTIRENITSSARGCFFKDWQQKVQAHSQSLLAAVEQCVQESVENAHSTYATRQPALYGVNILDKLQQHYPDPHNLQQYVNDLVASTVPFISFDANQNNYPAVLAITMPAVGADVEFRARLSDLFTGACPADMECCIVDSHRQDEITLSAVKVDFPLSAVATLPDYRAFLLRRLEEQPAKARMSLYLKDYGAGQLHDLLPLTRPEFVKRLTRFMLLGEALDIFKADEQDGLPVYRIDYQAKADLTSEPYYFPTKTLSLMMGKLADRLPITEIDEELAVVMPNNLNVLSARVEQALRAGEFSDARKREILSNRIKGQLDRVYANQQDKLDSMVSIRFREQINQVLTDIAKLR